MTAICLVTAMLAMPGSASAQEAEVFRDFAGEWVKHGFLLTVHPNGYAQASWRTYRWCHEPGSGPCDYIGSDRIVDGGAANMYFDRLYSNANLIFDQVYFSGPTMTGQVMSTTHATILRLGPVAMVLGAYGLAVIGQPDEEALVPIVNIVMRGEPTVLCGLAYPQDAPDSVKRQFPCGA
jgi:hypothetical protein